MAAEVEATPAFTITAVTEAVGARTQKVVVQYPQHGSRPTGYGFTIDGRAALRGFSPVAVQVRNGTTVLTEVPSTSARGPTPRQLVKRIAGRVDARFQLGVSALVLPPRFEIAVVAVSADGSVLELARIRGVRPRVARSYEPALVPILLDSLGRTGTTFAMRVLGEHPDVAAHRRHPYEIRYAQWWAQVLLVLSAPANHSRSHDGGSFLTDRFHAGHNPFHHAAVMAEYAEVDQLGDWFATPVDGLAAVALRALDDFYGRVADVNGHAGATHFIEKLPHGRLYWPLADLYPRLLRVLLVRDPRDMLCSMLSFNDKRGTLRFGRETVASDEAFVWTLRDRMLESLALREGGAAEERLRYEDLVLRPLPTLEALLPRLGLDPSPAAAMLERASVETDRLRAHRTTADAAASVGRWRADLPPTLQGVAAEAFAELLPALGYEP